MKKLILSLLTTGLVFGAFAQDGILIKKVNTSQVAILVENAEDEVMTLKVTNDEGRQILRDRIISNEKFGQIYDLSALPEGIYSFRVNGRKSTVASASFQNYEISVPEVVSRLSKVGDNSFRLRLSSLEAEDIIVKIFDRGELIHTEKVNNAQGLHKIYKVKSASPEEVSFKVETSTGYSTYITEE